jgi:FkbM family methyltransferase
MAKPLAYYLVKLKHDGLLTILRRRASWYWSMIWRPLSCRTAGWMIERLGVRIRVDGAIFSARTPLIPRFEKGVMFFGGHEVEERAILGRWLIADLPVVELGGGIGVIACLTNRKLARPQDHIVVEANPEIVPLLEQNRDLNGCRFRVLNKALAYGTDAVDFGVGPRFVGSRVGGAGTTVAVEVTSLEAIAAEAGFDRISLICDIEGAEAELVERELDTLRRRVRLLIVEIHPGVIGEEAAARMVRTLEASGFVLRDRVGRNWAFTRD